MLDHLANSCGCSSRYAAVILRRSRQHLHSHPIATHRVYMCPGESVFTRMFCAPSSQAMLRPICSTADLDVLYDTHAWSCPQLSLAPAPVVSAHPVCDAPRHRRNQDDAPPAPKSCHLSASCLCREQHARRVHLQHLHPQQSVLPCPARACTHVLELLRRVRQAIRVRLQDPRRCNAKVKSLLLVPNLFRLLPQHLLVPHVRTKVLHPRSVPQLTHILPRRLELLRRRLWQIETVDDPRTRLSECDRHLKPKSPIPP